MLEMSMSEITEVAELIFEGTVVSVESREDGPEGPIHTYVVFEVLDVIKGDWPEATLELRFLGGGVGDKHFQVMESNIPRLGEHGVYFVESPEIFYVNPILGWAQGHFLVKRDSSGDPRVHTFKGDAVLGFEPRGNKKAAGINSGAASGLRTAKDNESNKALTPEQFKNSIRTLIKDEK